MLSNFKSDQAYVVVLPAQAEAIPAANASATKPAVGTRGSNAFISPEVQRIVDTVAARTAVSAQLLHAVIAAESRYEQDAVSRKGAIGLMQLLPATAKRFGAQDPFDPYQNIAAGASYLKWLMGVFDDDLELVLAAYNAGEQAVIKAGRKVPPYSETQAYVKKIIASLRRDT